MFAEKLKELRKRFGLTQTALAKEIGVSQGTVYFWEKGVNEPTAVYVAAVAEYFGISADELLGVRRSGRERTRDAEEEELTSLYRALPAERRRIAVALLKALLDDCPRKSVQSPQSPQHNAR